MTDLVVQTASRTQGIQRRSADGADRLFSDPADGQRQRSVIARV